MQRASSAKSRRVARSGDTPLEARQMEKYFRILAPEKQRIALRLLKALVKAQGRSSELG